LSVLFLFIPLNFEQLCQRQTKPPLLPYNHYSLEDQ